MCNEFAREKSLDELAKLFSRVEPLPLFVWEDGRIPNDLAAKSSVRISDTTPVIRLTDGKLVGSMTPWAWRGPSGKPVFNFQSEGRDFSRNDRVLIFATGFYEYTAPAAPRVKLKDQHLFTMPGEDWFWIAGIARDGAFTMLTTAPGPDIAPFHDRQVVTLRPEEGLAWLSLSRPPSEILKAGPAGSLQVRTLRRDGVSLAA